MSDHAQELEALRTHGSQRKAAEALGISLGMLQRRLRIAAQRGEVGAPPIPEIARPPEGFAISHNAGAYDADGKLLRQWIGTKRDAGETFEVPAGHVVKGESALVDPEGRVLAKWIKTKEGVNTAVLSDALVAAFGKYDGAAPKIEAPEVADADLLVVYPIPDLHFGMYSWGAETGADYDTEIATRMAMSKMAMLVHQSLPSEHAVVLVLGDYFHQNDQKNATPGSGHRLDVDGRWSKVYHDGAMLLLDIVRLVATKHKSVEVKILPGNHDEDAAVTLTVAISLFFSKSDRITVNMEPGTTWYRRHGTCLIGAHHGHTMKAEAMAMAMAVDRPVDWGASAHRSFYSGHIHHETAKEVMGVRVESFSSPAAPDGYNSSHGYRSGRSFSAITHHKQDGEVGRHRVNIARNS
jgi:hypothetical protein